MGVVLNEMVVVVLQAVNQPYCASCVIWSLLQQIASKLVFLCLHAGMNATLEKLPFSLQVSIVQIEVPTVSFQPSNTWSL